MAEFEYKAIKPITKLSDFVESFWMLANYSDKNKEIVILPDGRIDLIFSCAEKEPFSITLIGLENKPTENLIPAKTVLFSISLKLLAVEYLLGSSISNLLNEAQLLPYGFWEIEQNDLNDFESFCNKVSTKILTLIKEGIDVRKQKLFKLIYSSNGAMPVKDLAEQVGWSSRQINRYFNQQFGISLKAYCTILRFRASLGHLKEGKLFPEQNFSDQTHFINSVKKFSGVTPKELSKNKNDRFILFSTLAKK